MSYCVNCGVELAPSEPVCPLCHTEVQNPRQPFDRKAPQPFPARLDLFRPQSDRGFTAAIITLVLLLPAAICLACDVAYTSSAGWSMLVIGAMAMLWVFIVPALFIHRHPILFGVILDTAALLGYLFVVEHFAARGLWFLHMALPIVVMVAGLFAVDYGLISKVVRGKFRQAAVVLLTAPILPLGIEIILDLYLQGEITLQWSFFVAIPCLILALLLLLLGRRERFRNQMKKRLHM